MTRIEHAFIRNHFQADYIEHVDGGWATVRDAVLNARRILSSPDKYPRADFDYLEKVDLDGTSCLLGAPVQYIV